MNNFNSFYIFMKKILPLIFIFLSIFLISCEKSKETEQEKTENKNENIFDEIGEIFEWVFEEKYDSPWGEQHMSFSISIKNGRITKASAQWINTQNPIAQKIQQRFISALSDAVVGKTVEEVQAIEEIGDAPLSTQAFQDALKELLKQQWKDKNIK